MNKKIADFENFEYLLEQFEAGDNDPLNEGLFTGIANFFSRMFGGKVAKLDKLLSKYKSNETDYWDRWASANHDLNVAELMHSQATDPTKKQEYVEMAERNEKLLGQIEKTHNEVNDALDRQADNIIGTNRRLFDYWDFMKAKHDEAVSKKKYDILKSKADPKVLDVLYNKVQKAANKLKSTTKDATAATKTILPGTFRDRSKSDSEVPFKEFGIFSIEDFLFSSDELWDDRTKIMPRANLKLLTQELDKMIKEIDARADKEIAGYKAEMSDIKDSDTSKNDKIARLQKSIDDAKKYSDSDIKVLSERSKKLKNKILVG